MHINIYKSNKKIIITLINYIIFVSHLLDNILHWPHLIPCYSQSTQFFLEKKKGFLKKKFQCKNTLSVRQINVPESFGEFWALMLYMHMLELRVYIFLEEDDFFMSFCLILNSFVLSDTTWKLWMTMIMRNLLWSIITIWYFCPK